MIYFVYSVENVVVKFTFIVKTTYFYICLSFCINLEIYNTNMIMKDKLDLFLF